MSAITFSQPNLIGAGEPSRISGPLICDNDTPDGYIFMGPEAIICDSSNMTYVRAATGDWSRQRTAAGAETYNFEVQINGALFSRLGLTFPIAVPGGGLIQNKGIKITKLVVYNQITVAALTSHTVQQLSTTAYVNNVADAVTAYSATTGALPTAAQANPYASVITVTTPVFFNTQDALLSFDWQAVMAINGVYSVKGVGVYFTYNFN